VKTINNNTKENMKKILILILLISIKSFSQGLSFHYGTSSTITTELSGNFNDGKTVVGINYSFYVGNPDIASYMPINTATPTNLYFKDNFSKPNNAMFITIGNQSKHLSTAIRLGMQNSTQYTTFTNNTSCFYYKETTPYDLLVGVSLGYKLEDDFAINVGYDNFNRTTIGFTIYWGKSHHTNHMCKPTY
jgi:hypothetical protein